MYRIKYNDLIIFDPYDTNDQVFDAKLSQKINSAAYLDFTISKEHPLYDTVKERDGVVSLSWIEESGEQEKLFEGVIDSISINFYGHKEISCISALDYLNDTVVRPYSTIAGEQDLTAPSSVEGYFDWLIEQHNNHILDSKKRFNIGINQGAGFRISDYIYRSSTDNPTTASEISNKILESLGGYLILDYGETSNTLNLYSDIHEINTQIIDFGVNLLDFTKKTETDKQYTAVIPIGGSPKFVDGGFEDDNSFWLSPDNLSLSSDKVHSGNKSAYFVEGTGEFINKSFFYAKHNATYKSTIWIKNERKSAVKIYPSYQTSADDSWENQTPNNVKPMDIPNDDQWHEYSFTFSTNVSNGMKIRPRWVFDPVSNDNGARVYVDDFDFSRVIGDNVIEEDPISISTLGDGVTEFEHDFVKHGDVIYSSSAVQRYGYKEKVFQDTTITDARVLMQEAVRQLNMCLEPTINIDVKAIDLSLYMNGYSHLKIGQAVRIRSAIHKTDLYLIVSSIDINLQNPAQTSYELGEAYDTLSGKQSSYLQSLNSAINSSLDAVASLDQTTKDQAIQIESVENVAQQAQNTADNAQQSADTAQQTANANKEQINAVKDKQSEHDALIEQAKKDIAASEAEISGINDRMTQMDSDIDTANAAANAAQAKADSVGSDLASFRTETNKTVQNVRDSVSKTQADVDAVTKKASDLSADLDATKATVSQTVTEFGEVKTTATNAASKADQSLRVSTQASQTATSASQTATSAYNDAQTAITKSSEAVQTANSVSLSLKTDYQTKADADAKYATQASLTATSDQIKTEVSKTYATQATVNALENIANNAVQTWMGTGAPTLTNKPASDWNTAGLKTQHSGDIYYDTDTGYSYRFGSSDGSTYSWALIKDTDISKAIADAAKAQKTADSATSGVSELKSSIPVTYATKTELTQKADSITSRVEEVAQAGTATSSKVTQLEQKTDEIKSTVSEQRSKLNNAVTTISQVSQKADSISSTVQQVQGNLNSLDFGGTNLVKLGRYEFNSSVTNTSYNRDQDLYTFTVPANLTSSWGYGLQSRWGKSYVYAGVPWEKCCILSFYIYTDRACTINVDVNNYPMTADGGSGNDHDNTSKRANSSYSIPANQWVQVWSRWENSNSTESTGNPTKDDLYDASSIGVISSSNAINVKIKRIKFEVGTKPTAWSPCPADVDANIGTAQGTANSALSKASTVEQTLDGFRTNVSQTYETKTDALNKQSTLNQKVDSLRSEVTETYATKTQLNNASSTTNMWPNQWFGTSKPCIGRAPVGDEIEAAPVGGNIRIIDSRDHHNGSVSSSVMPGRKYKVSVDAKKISGTKSVISGGIWYTVQSSGRSWDGFGDFAKVKDYGNNWYRFERTVTVPDGKTMGTAWLQLSENTSLSTTAKWKISNLRFEDVTDVADIQANYSTKSYVDQTARTVSLGVVEEYKNGQHGSALATQSDISIAKESITSTVSQTYATKQALIDTDGKAVTAGNKANLALANAQNMVMNTGNDLANTWGNNGVTAENGVYTRTFPGNENHFDFLWGGLSGKAIPGHTYSISFDARVDSGDFISDDYFVFGWSNAWSAVHAQGLSGNWHTFAVNTTVSGSGTDAPVFFMSSYMTSAGAKVVQFRNLSIRDITEVAQLQSDVAATYASKSEVKQTVDGLNVTISGLQSTANTASSNAANAQNRVGNLETCIKMTTDGVRVGKIDNGNFSGYSALVNSNGSFDIVDAGGNTTSRFDLNSISLANNNADATISMLNGQGVINANSNGINLSSNNVQLTAGSPNSGQTFTVKEDGLYFKEVKIYPPFSVLASQTWPDISVSAYSHAGFVTVSIRRWGKSGKALFPLAPRLSIVGKVDPEYAPVTDLDVLIGVSGNTWLEMTVRTNGDIGIYSIYSRENVEAASFGGLATYSPKKMANLL